MDAGALYPIVPLTSVTVQLTVTPLLATRQLQPFESLLFYFINDDAANLWTATIETGETSDALDAVWQPQLLVPASAAGKAGQNSLTVGPSQLRAFYRVSGIATGAPVAARWGLYGVRRYARTVISLG